MAGLHFSFVLVLLQSQWTLTLGSTNGTVTPEQLTQHTSSRNGGNEGTLKPSKTPKTTIEPSTQPWTSDVRSRPLTQTRPDTIVSVAMESDFNISTITMQPNTTKDQSGEASVGVATTKRDSRTKASDAPFPNTVSQVSTVEMTSTTPQSNDEPPTDQPLATTSDSTAPGSTVMSKTNPTSSTTAREAVDMTTSTNGPITQVVTTQMPAIASTVTAVTAKREPTDRTTQSTNQKPLKDTVHYGSVVAVLIGGSLIIMILGFVVIFIRRSRLQRKQMTNTEWAGPSPFLDSVADDDTNGQVHLRGSQRISLVGFLPQRLSTRLSLLQETNTDYKMENVPGSTFGRELSAAEVKPSIETNLKAKEIKEQEFPSSISPTNTSTDHDSDPKTPAAIDDAASSSDHSDVHPLSPPKDSLPLMDVDASPGPGAIPSAPNTPGAVIPPAPPLLT